LDKELDMTAVIRDTSGRAIASVTLSTGDNEQTIRVERVLDGKGTLLNYYFGRGGRRVTIESEMFQLTGILKTNWVKNERKWRVEVEPAETFIASELVARQAS